MVVVDESGGDGGQKFVSVLRRAGLQNTLQHIDADTEILRGMVEYADLSKILRVSNVILIPLRY